MYKFWLYYGLRTHPVGAIFQIYPKSFGWLGRFTKLFHGAFGGNFSSDFSTHFVTLVLDFPLITHFFYKNTKILRYFKGISIWFGGCTYILALESRHHTSVVRELYDPNKTQHWYVTFDFKNLTQNRTNKNYILIISYQQKYLFAFETY